MKATDGSLPDTQKKLEAETDEALQNLQAQTAQLLDEKLQQAMEISPLKLEDFADNKVECQKCGANVFPHEAQVRGKMVWWCHACNATMKSLRSRLSWPPNGFETLPEAEKKSFFARVKELKETEGEVGYKRVKDLLIRSMSSKRIEELMKERGGTYLPISLFTQRSWPASSSFSFEDVSLTGVL